MRLIRNRHERVRGRDADHRRARLAQVLVRRAARVEGAQQIDVDHRLESVGRHAQHRRGKIARRAAHQDVDRAERLARPAQRVIAFFVIAHVARDSHRFSARRPYTFGRPVEFVLLAPHQTHLGALRRKAFGDAQIDAAAAAGDECNFVLQ